MSYPFGIFQRTGIELEYMVVDRRSLDVLPIVDRALHAVAGDYAGEVALGDISWSNELTLHVIELKTTEPAASLAGVAERFHRHAMRLNALMAPMNGRLLPGGMHPWMDPSRQMFLWPHGHNEIYEAFNRIFDCRGHGWANLQSMHINLPFGDDTDPRGQFGRLHAATRLLLPILPALSASSPVMDGRVTGIMDNRLAVYRTNAARVPVVSGRVIPEPAFTGADYHREILEKIYRDLSPHDPAGLLRHEWANARGCIARFQRGSIEIRVLDVQECPAMDLAIAAASLAVLRGLVAEKTAGLAQQQAWPAEPLAEILDAVVRDADRAVVRDVRYLRTLGYGGGPIAAGELWAHLLGRLGSELPEADRAVLEPIDVILRRGPLSRRILAALGPAPDKARMLHVYRDLADALEAGKPFVPASA